MKYLLGLALAASLIACGESSSTDAVVGDWALDVDHMVANVNRLSEEAMKAQGMDLSKMPQAAKDAAKAQIDAMRKDMAGVTVSIRGDGTWSGTLPDKGSTTKASGTWVARDGGYDITDSRKDAEKVRITIEDGALMARPEGSPMALRMVRK